MKGIITLETNKGTQLYHKKFEVVPHIQKLCFPCSHSEHYVDSCYKYLSIFRSRFIFRKFNIHMKLNIYMYIATYYKYLVYFIDLHFPANYILQLGKTVPFKNSSCYHIKFRIFCRLFVLTKCFYLIFTVEFCKLPLSTSNFCHDFI